MNLIRLIIISFSLAMDAFAVSICKGLSNKELSIKKSIIVGLYFGFFQALMPIFGFFLGNILRDKIMVFDHYIAFILLSYIGISMIKEAKRNDDYNNSIKIKEMITLSIATSLDALIVGITLSFLNVNIIQSVSIIGLITTITCFTGFLLGTFLKKKFGKIAQIIGGIILILIGFNILINHLS